MIKRYSPVANFTDGGEGVSGFIHTRETKIKCRNATLALRQNPEWLNNNLTRMREVCASEENRKKLSKIGKERFVNRPESRENMRIKQSLFIQNNPEAAKARQKKSTEAKRLRENRIKNARSQGGRPFNMYKNGELIGTFELMTDCVEGYQLHKAAICRCLKDHQKDHKGYTFKYVQEIKNYAKRKTTTIRIHSCRLLT